MTKRVLSVLCVIDHLGAGGAQRQMAALACALKRAGHSVEVFVYFPDERFFRHLIDACGIKVHEFSKGGGFSLSLLKALSGLIRRQIFDVVLSYLNTPNVYLELSRLTVRGPRLVVSERSSHHADRSRFGAAVRRRLHMLADHVVTNSHAQAKWLLGKPWLDGKVSCIYNGLDLDAFDPQPLPQINGDGLSLLGVGRVGLEKNQLNLIQAMCLLQDNGRPVPHVAWAGRFDGSWQGRAYLARIHELLAKRPDVAARWNWLGERNDIAQLLAEHHALIHPSSYEGLPNVVCEAMAAARPVLVSRVCDHPVLVEEGQRGFLFDPADPSAIAQAIDRFGSLPHSERLVLARNARAHAHENLGVLAMASAYEALFNRLLDYPLRHAST